MNEIVCTIKHLTTNFEFFKSLQRNKFSERLVWLNHGSNKFYASLDKHSFLPHTMLGKKLFSLFSLLFVQFLNHWTIVSSYVLVNFPDLLVSCLHAHIHGGDETRLGYMRYVQGIQPNVPACTVFIDICSRYVHVPTPDHGMCTYNRVIYAPIC